MYLPYGNFPGKSLSARRNFLIALFMLLIEIYERIRPIRSTTASAHLLARCDFILPPAQQTIAKM